MTKQKTILITRPREDAAPLAALLESQCHKVIVAPLMQVRYLDTVLPAGDHQAILLTSANGARALARATGSRDMRLIAVGEASQAAAKQAGFLRVDMADVALGGDAAGLAAYVVQRYRPDAGPLLHVCGLHVAGDLAGMLATRGFKVTTLALYEARAVAALPPEVQMATMDAVLLYSPRTAKLFLQLYEGPRAGIEAFALSRNVADILESAGFARVRVAEAPTQAALLALLRQQE